MKPLFRCALGALPIGLATPAFGAIMDASSFGDLTVLMGSPLIPVPDDGSALGTGYGHPPSLTPGLPLPTPIGAMGFMPTHERISAGSPASSGTFHALPIGGPGGIAGSDVIPPVGATAIGFYLEAEIGSVHSFEITAVGTATSHTIVIPGVSSTLPVFVGFGALGGETLVDISIVKLPFPTTTMVTWNVFGIEVLPSPGTPVLALGALGLALRRRR